jgi:hypothetical protein
MKLASRCVVEINQKEDCAMPRIKHLLRLSLYLMLALSTLAQATTILPIEVLGPVGTMRSVSVDTTRISTTLALRIHGAAHAGMVELQINNRPWVALSNTTATVTGLAAKYGGIGGSFNTVDLRLPVGAPALAVGSHTIKFRFAASDNVTIGFRVLRLNLLDASGQTAVAASDFVNDNPASWTAPLPSPSDRIAGETLWRQAALIEGSPGAPIRARCGDCHTQNGYDLAYFNFSNTAIIERSKFHGLSDLQGQQIASFIRSMPGSQNGRPWNPPYQPGPGLDTRPVSEWAAGAGLDAVLVDDVDGLAALPVVSQGARALIDVDGTIANIPVHSLPKAFQLMDWNHWLPRIHPLDNPNPNFSFNSSTAKLEYDLLRQRLSAPDAEEYFYNQFNASASNVMPGASHLFDRYSGAIQNLKEAVIPPIVGQSIMTLAEANRVYSAALLGTVKMWEIMQEFGLEGRGRKVYGVLAPERQWYSNRFIFDASPFLNGIPGNLTLFGDNSPSLQSGSINFEFLNNAWYELQMQLNSGRGSRSAGGHGVIDWGYMAGHFSDLYRNSGTGEPVRRAIFAMTSMQQHDSGTGPEFAGDGNPGGDGWDLPTSPIALMDLNANYWSGFTPLQSKILVQSLLHALAEKSGRYTRAQWLRAKGHDGANMPAANYVLGTDQGEARERNVAEQYVGSLLDAKRVHQIDQPIANGIAAVGQMIWANNDWSVYRSASANIGAPAQITATAGVRSIAVNWSAVTGASSYNLYRADAQSGPFAPMLLMSTERSALDRGLEAGVTWFYRVSANVAGSESAAVSFVASAAADNGLVARWGFDEISSGNTIFDASTQGNHGQLIGVQRIAGRNGGAIRATAARQFASVANDLARYLEKPNVTVTVWLRTSTLPSGNQTMTVLGGMSFFGMVSYDGKIAVKIGDSGTVRSTISIVNGQWRHVAMSRDSNNSIKIWIDGALNISGQTAANTETYQIHDLGRGNRLNGGDTTWLGDLDDIRIYDQILDAAAVNQVMNDPTLGPTGTPGSSLMFANGFE